MKYFNKTIFLIVVGLFQSIPIPGVHKIKYKILKLVEEI